MAGRTRTRREPFHAARQRPRARLAGLPERGLPLPHRHAALAADLPPEDIISAEARAPEFLRAGLDGDFPRAAQAFNAPATLLRTQPPDVRQRETETFGQGPPAAVAASLAARPRAFGLTGLPPGMGPPGRPDKAAETSRQLPAAGGPAHGLGVPARPKAFSAPGLPPATDAPRDPHATAEIFGERRVGGLAGEALPGATKALRAAPPPPTTDAPGLPHGAVETSRKSRAQEGGPVDAAGHLAHPAAFSARGRPAATRRVGHRNAAAQTSGESHRKADAESQPGEEPPVHREAGELPPRPLSKGPLAALGLAPGAAVGGRGMGRPVSADGWAGAVRGDPLTESQAARAANDAHTLSHWDGTTVLLTHGHRAAEVRRQRSARGRRLHSGRHALRLLLRDGAQRPAVPVAHGRCLGARR